MDPHPEPVIVPRAWRAIVRWLAPSDEAGWILDDLAEEAAQVEASRGASAARRWIRWQVLHSLLPWIARRGREGAASTLRGIGSDVRIATRRMLQARAFTLLAVLTLALGIGAVSAVFSLAYALWLKPLPYREPDRLVWIHAKHERSGATSSLTVAEFAEHRRESQSLGEVAGFRYGAGILRALEPVRIVAHPVTPNLFRVLGTMPAIGRGFTASDAREGARVAMLGHALWTTRFGRDRAVVGKTLTLDGITYEIVGVMPAGFSFPRGPLEADIWIPSETFGVERDEPARLVEAIARLRPGHTIAGAAAEAGARARQLAVASSTSADWTVQLTPAGTTASTSGRRAFSALLGIVGLFLLIACANLGGLLIARNAARRPELALCLSIGASRLRLARMLVIESTLLALLGCALGVLFAAYAARAFAAVMPPHTPGLEDVAVNPLVVTVAVGAALLCAALISMLPALSLRSMRPAEALAGARTIGGGSARAQRVLVVAEIALAVVLVVGAGVMLRALAGLLERDRGYDPRGLIALNVSLPFSDDSYLPQARRARAFDDMLARVAAVPGVRSAAATTGFPGSPLGVLTSTHVTPSPGGRPVIAAVHATSAGYFDTMAIPITAGRPFGVGDATDAPRVAIVNEFLARQFPSGNPLGQRISLAIYGEQKSYEIVGVAGNIRLTDHIGNRIFVPMTQASSYWIDLVVRGERIDRLTRPIREALRGFSPELLLENESSFQRIINNSVALERTQSAFAALIGALAMIVSAVGLYGLMTFVATQRRREFGIRLALGSHPRRLFRDTFVSAIKLVATGIAVGTGFAALLVRLVGSQVFGLESAGITAYSAGALLVLLVAMIAVWIPARRVMRIDPLVALRLD